MPPAQSINPTATDTGGGTQAEPLQSSASLAPGSCFGICDKCNLNKFGSCFFQAPTPFLHALMREQPLFNGAVKCRAECVGACWQSAVWQDQAQLLPKHQTCLPPELHFCQHVCSTHGTHVVVSVAVGTAVCGRGTCRTVCQWLSYLWLHKATSQLTEYGIQCS